MQIKTNVRLLCSRVQTILRQRRRKQVHKPLPEISAPFDFKREPVLLPGVSQEELSILREKAAASRIGVAETMPPSPMLSRNSSRSPIVASLPSAKAPTSSTSCFAY